MRRRVDAEREAAHDDEPGVRSALARTSRRAPCPARVALRLPDDRERGLLQQLDAALRIEHRRRIGDLQQRPADTRLIGEREDAVRRIFEPAPRPRRVAVAGVRPYGRCGAGAGHDARERGPGRGEDRGGTAERDEQPPEASRRSGRREAQGEPGFQIGVKRHRAARTWLRLTR